MLRISSGLPLLELENTSIVFLNLQLRHADNVKQILSFSMRSIDSIEEMALSDSGRVSRQCC